MGAVSELDEYTSQRELWKECCKAYCEELVTHRYTVDIDQGMRMVFVGSDVGGFDGREIRDDVVPFEGELRVNIVGLSEVCESSVVCKGVVGPATPTTVGIKFIVASVDDSDALNGEFWIFQERGGVPSCSTTKYWNPMAVRKERGKPLVAEPARVVFHLSDDVVNVDWRGHRL